MTPPLKGRKTIPVVEDTTLVFTTVRMTLENANFAGRRQVTDDRAHDEGGASDVHRPTTARKTRLSSRSSRPVLAACRGTRGAAPKR